MSLNHTNLGSCCGCGQKGPTVRNLLMLPQKAPTPGFGWACFQCHLPADGAVAVVCDVCFERLKAKEEKVLRFAVDRYPFENLRVPIESLSGEHKHNMALHPGEEREPA